MKFEKCIFSFNLQVFGPFSNWSTWLWCSKWETITMVKNNVLLEYLMVVQQMRFSAIDAKQSKWNAIMIRKMSRWNILITLPIFDLNLFSDHCSFFLLHVRGWVQLIVWLWEYSSMWPWSLQTFQMKIKKMPKVKHLCEVILYFLNHRLTFFHDVKQVM